MGNASLTTQIWALSLAFLPFEVVDEILKFDDANTANKGFFEFFAVILFILLCKACLFFCGSGCKILKCDHLKENKNWIEASEPFCGPTNFYENFVSNFFDRMVHRYLMTTNKWHATREKKRAERERLDISKQTLQTNAWLNAPYFLMVTQAVGLISFSVVSSFLLNCFTDSLLSECVFLWGILKS